MVEMGTPPPPPQLPWHLWHLDRSAYGASTVNRLHREFLAMPLIVHVVKWKDVQVYFTSKTLLRSSFGLAPCGAYLLASTLTEAALECGRLSDTHCTSNAWRHQHTYNKHWQLSLHVTCTTTPTDLQRALTTVTARQHVNVTCYRQT